MIHNPFKVGDRVMFANRTQITSGGMPIEIVDTNMFDTLLKVDGKWWPTTCFIPLDEWKSRYQD
jgi:hypothetical protein